jgi:hypothetical protein
MMPLGKPLQPLGRPSPLGGGGVGGLPPVEKTILGGGSLLSVPTTPLGGLRPLGGGAVLSASRQKGGLSPIGSSPKAFTPIKEPALEPVKRATNANPDYDSKVCVPEWC